MFKNMANTLVTAVATFIVTGILSIAVQYWALEHGTVTIGPTINLAGKLYMPVDIVNYSSQALEKLRLSVPSATAPDSIVTTRPLNIEPAKDVTGTHTQKRLLISGLEARQLTRLLIPIASEGDARLVELLNGAELNLKPVPAANVSYPILIVLRDAAISALFTTVLYTIFVYWLYDRLDRRDRQLKETREETDRQLKEMREELDKFRADATAGFDRLRADATAENSRLQANLSTVGNSNSRLRILLLARLADYAKELDFWRNTMAKLVLTAGGSKQDVEAINKQITESLKTFTTRSRAADDFDTITAVASMLHRAEEVKSSDNKHV
jgi:hypothetical protein